MKLRPKIAILLVLACLATTNDSTIASPRNRHGDAMLHSEISYDLATNSVVSINIYDASGRIVRELLHETPRKVGLVTEVWDGRNNDGAIVQRGTYSWKLLATQGLHARYLTTLGTSPANGWDQWPGNFAGIYAICTDGDSLYLGSYGQSTIMLVKQSFDGTRQWVVPAPFAAWQGPIALARSADCLFMLQPNCLIYRLDADTSEVTGRIDASWDLPDSRLPPNLLPKRPITPPHDSLWQGACTSDMTATNNQLAVSYYAHDAIRWFDPVTGRQTGEVKTDSPLGVAFTQQGSLLAISKGCVVSVSRVNPVPATLISAEPNAYRIAVDQANGDILLAERSPGNQVKRYDKSGKLIATYGNIGGRRQGLYDPQSFARITDIAAGSGGGFIVSETSAPRRVASFDSNGQVQHEWFGPQSYAPHCEIDSAAPNTAWGDSEPGTLVEYSLDLARRKWSVRATYRYDNLADGFFSDVRPGPQNWHVHHREGKTYLCRNEPFGMLRVDENAGRLIPLAGIMTVTRTNANPILADALDRAKTGMLDVLWTDSDGDGKPSAAELIPLGRGVWTSGRGAVVGDDLSLTTIDSNGLHVLRPTWSQNDAPQYGVDQVVPLSGVSIANLQPECPASDSSLNIWSLYSANDHDGRNVRGLAKWNSNGMLGSIVSQSVVTSSPDRYLARIVGTTHGCFAVSDSVNGNVDVWDQDGLWVGQFLEDPDFASAPRPAYRLNPLFLGHSVFTDPTTGDVLFVGSGVNNNPVIRITGWDGWQRDSGTITWP